MIAYIQIYYSETIYSSVINGEAYKKGKLITMTKQL